MNLLELASLKLILPENSDWILIGLINIISGRIRIR